MINELMSQEPVYFIMALVGSVLFLLKTLMLLLGGDTDGDIDLTDGGEIDVSGHIDGSVSFALVSVQSILAFLMGAGWAGLAARREWGFGSLESIAVATAVGLVLMSLSAFLTFKIKGLNVVPQFDMKSAVGLKGIAYSVIPAKGQGVGQVQISVNQKKQTLQALSNGEKIKSFEQVKVVAVDDSDHLIVEPV